MMALKTRRLALCGAPRPSSVAHANISLDARDMLYNISCLMYNISLDARQHLSRMSIVMHPSCACPPPTELTCGSGCWPLLMVTASVLPSLVLPSSVISIVLAWCVDAGACCAATSACCAATSASPHTDMPFLSPDKDSAPDFPTTASGWCGDRDRRVESSLKARDTSLKSRYGDMRNKSGGDRSLKWRCGDRGNK